MNAIGIDFGNDSCYVAAAISGGIETLSNDYSLRATPSYVAFDGKRRIIGVAAKNQQVTNIKNTVYNLKQVLGRKFNDPQVQRERRNLQTNVEHLMNDGIAFKLNYLNQEQYFTPEQLTAMLFTKLKDTSAAALKTQVKDCVITCPIYFTNPERKALLDAAQIAGLNVIRLMNEGTAIALSYGFYKTDLPEENEKARYVVFVDCGHSSLQVSACAFHKDKLKMIGSSCDQIGGRDFDVAMAEYFIKDIHERYNIDATTNARSYLRLLNETEKLKKQMSTINTILPLNIECFMNEKDVSSSMKRSQMEDLCLHIFQRIETIFRKLLRDCKITREEIHSVEVVGGSTRIPAIKLLIEKIFGKPACTTLNQDEAVARGAAIQCALLSPNVRGREFGVTDIQNYAVKARWEGDGSHSERQIEIFPAFHGGPFCRTLTLSHREPFTLTLEYSQPIPHPDTVIGKWFIKGIKPDVPGEYEEIKVKIRKNEHGIVSVANVSLVDFSKVDDSTNADDAATTANQENCDQVMTNGTDGMHTNVPQDSPEQKKKSTKLLELSFVDMKPCGLSSPELQNYMKQEAKMIANDVKETKRADARNELEEFVYEMREKLQGGCFEPYVMESDRDRICAQLNETEKWLYSDGADCDREAYVKKWKNLCAQTDPIKERAYDFERASIALEELNNSILFSHDVLNQFKNGSPKFDHLTEADFLNITEAADKAQKLLDTHYAKLSQAQRTAKSPVKVVEIIQQNQVLNNCVNSIINRPKPKSAAKPSSTNEANATAADDQNVEDRDNAAQNAS